MFSSHPEVLEHADLLRELVQVVAVQVKHLTKQKYTNKHNKVFLK